jgi:hypothetical protein
MPGASKAWIIILALVFVMNVFVLIYFILHRGLVTDFSEPPNLFALAVNSPPSHVLAGSCGGGPQGEQYGVSWFVNHEGSHLYMEPGEKAPLISEHEHGHVHTQEHGQGPMEDAATGMARGAGGFFASVAETVKRGLGIKEEQTRAKLRRASAVESFRPAVNTLRRGSMASDYEMQDGLTRTRRQYQKLAKRRSVL